MWVWVYVQLIDPSELYSTRPWKAVGSWAHSGTPPGPVAVEVVGVGVAVALDAGGVAVGVGVLVDGTGVAVGVFVGTGVAQLRLAD